MQDIRVFDSPDAVAEHVAGLFVEGANSAEKAGRYFSVAFAGGETPRLLYRYLSQRKRGVLNWSNIMGFSGDERFVPLDHPDSNYRMVCEMLLDHVPIPSAHIFPMIDGDDPILSAIRYERILRSVFAANAQNTFDLVLLGMGEDGHTASLFPNTEAISESTKWVTAHLVDRQIGWRITLTPAVINLARQVIVMVTGDKKALRLQEVLTGECEPQRLPIQAIMPTNGDILWAVDRAASTFLTIK